MIAPSYTSNQSAYPLNGFSNFFKRRSGGSLTFSSRARPSACEAQTMANELVASLRVLDKSIKENIDIAAADMAVCKKSTASKKTAHHKRIRELMLSQLGASELLGRALGASTVFFIEPGEEGEAGEEGDDALYLCRAICSKSDPLNSWTSERLLRLSGHAISRAFMRRCAWASGYAVTTESLVEELCALYAVYEQYMSGAITLLGKMSEFQRLSGHGWLLHCGVNDSQYIVGHQDQGFPCVRTVVSRKPDSLDDGALRMIPPKGRVGLPRLAVTLKEVSAIS